MMRPFHNWTHVYVSQSEIRIPPDRDLWYSQQCGRCGLLRHKVAALYIAGSAITYKLISKSHGGTRRWHYPDGRRWCSKPKDWLGRAA